MRPMLLREWNYADPAGWWVSEKFDGIRAIWDGKELRTRQGELVPCPAWFTKDLPPTPLDGELWTKRGDLNGMLSIFAKGERGDWKKVTFVLFDIPGPDPLETRLERLRGMLSPRHCHIARHVRCKDEVQLEDLVDEVARNGGEGVVLRAPGSFYVEGRSGDCRKLRLAA